MTRFRSAPSRPRTSEYVLPASLAATARSLTEETARLRAGLFLVRDRLRGRRSLSRRRSRQPRRQTSPQLPPTRELDGIALAADSVGFLTIAIHSQLKGAYGD